MKNKNLLNSGTAVTILAVFIVLLFVLTWLLGPFRKTTLQESLPEEGLRNIITNDSSNSYCASLWEGKAVDSISYWKEDPASTKWKMSPNKPEQAVYESLKLTYSNQNLLAVERHSSSPSGDWNAFNEICYQQNKPTEWQHSTNTFYVNANRDLLFEYKDGKPQIKSAEITDLYTGEPLFLYERQGEDFQPTQRIYKTVFQGEAPLYWKIDDAYTQWPEFLSYEQYQDTAELAQKLFNEFIER